jgi:hypothetical protein
VQQLDPWLNSREWNVGDGCAIAGYSFLIVGRSPASSVDLLTPVEELWVNSDLLAELISEKVSRYASLADRLDVPFVIVVGADEQLAIDAEMVRAAVVGTLSVSLNLNLFGSGSQAVSSGPLRLHADDTPRSWDPSLSAVGWLKTGIANPGTLSLFVPPASKRPHRSPLGGAIVGHMVDDQAPT